MTKNGVKADVGRTLGKNATKFPRGTYCVIYSWIGVANKHWKTIIGQEGKNERTQEKKRGRE